jgi:hypothetical protein
MKRGRKRLAILGLGCLVALVLGTLGGSAVAVPPHKHCLATPQGYVEVGPRVFKHPSLHETAFHQFHNHVHVGAPPTDIVPILDPAVACSSLNP